MMKVNIIILLIVWTFCDAYSQPEIKAVYENGLVIQREGVVLEEDICIFSIDGGVGSECVWSFQLDTKNGVYEIKEQSGITGPFSFAIKGLNIQELKNLKRYVFDNDSSVYFKGNVVLKNIGGDVIDCFPIRLNLLPALPEIKDVTLECGGFDWDLYQFIRPVMTFYFITSRETFYTIKYADNPNFSGMSLLGYPFEKVKDDAGVKVMCFENPPLCWDDYFILRAENHYGYTQAIDTILINNYVDDPDLLDEYNKWITSINVLNKENIAIYYNSVEESLCIERMSGQKDIKILRVDGTLIKHLVTSEEKICIPELRKGIYVVYIIVNDRILNQKILIN